MPITLLSLVQHTHHTAESYYSFLSHDFILLIKLTTLTFSHPTVTRKKKRKRGTR